jgi:Family of unknown function (DUF5723)
LKSYGLHRIFTGLTGILLVLAVQSSAQQSNTFYLLHDIPQSNLLNPAVQINCRWFVGIPGLSSTHVSYNNTAFTYKDLTEGNTWNLENIEAQTHRVDLYGAELSLQALSLGHRYKTFQFTLSLNDRAHFYQTIPGDLVSLAVYGNGSFVGDQTNLNPVRSFGAYVREYTFTVSKLISPRLTAGARAKLLFGKAGVSTGKTDIGLYTGENNFNLIAGGAYFMNISLPVSIEQETNGNISEINFTEIDFLQELLNRENPGMAIDLGLIYHYTDKLKLSVSILDLGLIRWKRNLNTISSEGTFVYDGISLGTDDISTNFIGEMIDSLRNSLTTTLTQDPYTSLQPTQIFLGGSYRLRDRLTLGAVNRNLLLRSKLHSSLTLSATADLTKNLLASLSWSLLNNSPKNLGAALAWRGKGFQFHLVSDNVLGFLQPFDTRSINLRMGCNILFGCPRTKKEKMETGSWTGTSVAGNCSWAGKQKKRKKRYGNIP